MRKRANELGGELLTDLPVPEGGVTNWTTFSLSTLDAAAASGRPVVFDLTNMEDVPGVLDGSAHADKVTSKELRHIKDNWDDKFKDNVVFCKDGKRADKPW